MANKLSIFIKDPERGKKPPAAPRDGAEDFRTEFDQRRLTRDESGDGILRGATGFTSHTFANIAHIGGKDRFSVYLKRGNGQLHIQLGTVHTQSGNFDAPAEERAGARSAELGHSGAMSGPQF